ncbi:MAG: hypothetical protein AAF490_28750 [Chloroflexota bacterium]
MKKIQRIVVVLLFSMLFIACGGQADSEPTAEPEVESEVAESEPTEAPEESAIEEDSSANETDSSTAEEASISTEEEPTEQPEEEPTTAPVEEPTDEPAEEPTDEPVEEPTAAPIEEPTAEPVEEPTSEPIEEPTSEPIEEPTSEPIEEPTSEPIEEPTPEPIEEPTSEPIEEPIVAAFDNDSLQNPSGGVNFLSITGTRNFIHQSDISFSGGDTEDYVAFEFPNNSNVNQSVWITLECNLSGDVGNAQMAAVVIEDGVEQAGETVICNSGEQQLTVDNTKVQTVRIYYNITNEGVYGTYTLTVVGFK